MKRKFALLWLASQFIALPQILGQSANQNLMKYWKHRDQLCRFVFKGENVNPIIEHGSYLVAEYVHPWSNCHYSFDLGNTQGQAMLYEEGYSDKCGGLNFKADATMLLGWYIGVLATEYRLLKNHGQPTAAQRSGSFGAP